MLDVVSVPAPSSNVTEVDSWSVGVGGWGGVIIGGSRLYVVTVEAAGRQRVVTFILQPPGLVFTSHKSVSRFFILLAVLSIFILKLASEEFLFESFRRVGLDARSKWIKDNE